MTDFTPNYTPITQRPPFRFWAQKVLPTVYDDSLSYYELLTKVVNYLNQNVDDINTISDNVDSIYNSFLELQSYVINYVETEMPQVVSDKLDAMAEDGTLTQLIKAYIDPLFEEETTYIEGRLDAQDTAIANAKSEQDTAIANAISQQNSNISTAINNFSLDIGVMQAQMTNFIADHAGLTNETVLWTGMANAVGDEIVLSDSPSNYKYIDVHYTLRDTAYPRHVQRFDAATFDNAHMGNGCVINITYSDNPTASSEAITSKSIKLQADNLNDKKFTIATANGWSWNGDSASDATNYVPTVHTSDGYTAGQIVKIVGVNEEQGDTEVIDARVGADGVIYDTLGDAIRTQVSDLNSDLFETIVVNNEYAYTDVTWVDGKYVAYNGGNTINSDTYSYCVVPLNNAIKLTGYTNAAPGSIIGLAFFSSDGTYISGDRSNNTGRYDYNFDLDVPNNAAYVYISCRTDYKNDFECTVKENTPPIQEQIDTINNTLDEGFKTESSYTKDNVVWVDGYYVTYDAAHFVALSGYSYCKIDLIKASKKLTGKSDTAPDSVIGLAFVNEIGQYISGDRSTNTGYYNYNFDINIPNGAKTVYISCRTDYKANFECVVRNDYQAIKADSDYLSEHKDMLDGLLGTGNYVYYGEKISITYENVEKKYQVALWKNFLGSEIQNLSDYRLHVCQSMAIFDGYIFCICADGTFAVIDFETKTLIYHGTYTPSEHQHANSAQFTDIYYDNADDFPLLLLSRCGNNSGETEYDECLVYRITKNNSTFTMTLINTIYVDFTTYGTSWAVDNVSKTLYMATLTNGTWQEEIENNLMLYAFRMPSANSITSGVAITLSKSDAVATMIYEKVVFQSMVANGGKLYLGASYGSGLEGLYCIDFWGNKIASKVYLPDSYEVEGLAIYNGKIYVDQTKGTDIAAVNPMKIYELTF